MDMSSTSATSTGDAFTAGDAFLNGLYDATTKNGGTALRFGIFDVQLSGKLSEQWLRGAIQDARITPEQADWMIGEGLLRKRINSAGDSGYILYTPYQAEVLTKLKETCRYGLDELRHIMQDWDDYLEAIVMEEPPYDDESIPDYQHFARRAREMREIFEDSEQQDRPEIITPEQWQQQRADAQTKLKLWRRVCELVANNAEEDLPLELQKSLQRELFHLRWWDEFVRLNMARKFETAIVRGFSTELVLNVAHGRAMRSRSTISIGL